MKRYVASRMLQAIPLLLGVVIINFTIIHLSPGDPVYLLVGEMGTTEEILQEARVEFGLDKPLHVQLYTYLMKVVTGDLGNSFYYKRPVLFLIVERIPLTMLLMLTQLVSATIIGILLGVVGGTKPNSISDNVTSLFTLAAYSTPVFWTAQVLVMMFALNLRLFPTSGFVSLRETPTGFNYVLDVAWHLVLPTITLGLHTLALIARLTRTAMIEVMGQDFIAVVRAKGLSDRTVVYRHGLRNALIPVVTVIGMNFGWLLAGAVLTETVFGWPGLGRLMFGAVMSLDYPLLLGVVIVISVMTILANLVTDVLYAVIDPRIRYGRTT